MTKQEAIERFQQMKKILSIPNSDAARTIEAIDMAIEALQQQSPCDICENEKEDCWEMCQFCPAEPKGGDEE